MLILYAPYVNTDCKMRSVCLSLAVIVTVAIIAVAIFYTGVATTATTATATAAAAIARTARRRRLPYLRSHGIAVSHGRRLARMIGYERGVHDFSHISSPVRRTRRSRLRLRQGRGEGSPPAGHKRDKPRRLFLRCPRQRSYLRG